MKTGKQHYLDRVNKLKTYIGDKMDINVHTRRLKWEHAIIITVAKHHSSNRKKKTKPVEILEIWQLFQKTFPSYRVAFR